jgi:hypothetical protein
MIEYNFENVKDNYRDKIAIVCGLGPSLSKNIDYIKNNRDEIIIISCNDVDINTDLIPDFWVFANSIQTLTFMYERFKKNNKSIIVHADSVDSTSREWIESNMSEFNYIGYDQRHFNNQKCNDCPNGCLNFIEKRLTLQEVLQNYTNHITRYSTGDTVAVHMLALSIIMGAKKIYITGVDLDYKKGYYGNNTINGDSFDPYLDNILNDFKIINESAKKIGVEIINLSDMSSIKDIFKTETKITI